MVQVHPGAPTKAPPSRGFLFLSSFATIINMIYYLLITIYLVIYLLLTIRKTEWGIYLSVLTLPSYLIRFNLGPIPSTLLELQILILFIIWAIKTLQHDKNKNDRAIEQPASRRQANAPASPNRSESRGWSSNRIINFLIPISIFLVTATVSAFISPNIRSALGLWKAYFIEPILFLIVFVTTIDKIKLKRVFMFLCFCVFVLSVLALYQKFTGAFIANPFWAAQTTRRVTSLFPYPNALALFLAPLITLFIGFIPVLFKNLNFKSYFKIKNYKITKFLLLTSYFLFLISSLLAIYFTKSKGALLAILTGLIFYALFYKPYRKYFIIILGAFFISLFLYFSISGQSINLHGASTVEGGDSISVRLDMWRETWAMLKNKPFLGSGLAGYQTAMIPYHQKNYIEIYLYPHNILLNFWTETGLLGLIAFTLIIILFYRNGFKQLQQAIKITSYQDDHRYLVGLLASMTTLLIHGLVDVPYFKNDLAVLFWLLIGSLIILDKKTSRRLN